MLSSGITRLTSSTSNHLITKPGFFLFFFQSCFHLNSSLTMRFYFPEGSGEKKEKVRNSSSESTSKAQSLMMGCPAAAKSQGQQVYSRTCTIPPIGAKEHPVLPRNAPTKGNALHAWQDSLLTTDIINQVAFCVKTQEKHDSLQLPFEIHSLQH